MTRARISSSSATPAPVCAEVKQTHLDDLIDDAGVGVGDRGEIGRGALVRSEEAVHDPPA
jgi:hypothetical protein